MSSGSNMPISESERIATENEMSIERQALEICQAFEIEEGIDDFTEDFYQLTTHLLHRKEESYVVSLYSDLGSAVAQFNDLYQLFLYPIDRISDVVELAKKIHDSLIDPTELNAEILKFMLGEAFDLSLLLKTTAPADNSSASFVVDNEKLAKRFNCDQRLYGQLMQRGVELAATGSKIYAWNFYSLLFFAAKWRGIIALSFNRKEALSDEELNKLLQEPMDTQFGETRAFEGFSTSILTNTPCSTDGPYADVALYIQERFLKDPLDLKDEVDLHLDGSNVLQNNHKTSSSLNDHCLVDLEKFHHNPLASEDHLKTYVTHTSPQNIPTILHLAEKVYTHAANAADKVAALKLLGELFWLICRAKPFRRGNSSIAEIVVKSVWFRKYGNHLPSWKKDVIPWAAAIKERNPQQFGEHFHLLLSTEENEI